MGAWGYEVFDDDTTCDIMGELRENDDIAGYCEKTFAHAISTDYLDVEEGSAVAVCAAIMDAVLKGTTYSFFLDVESDLEGDKQFANWISSIKSDNIAAFERMKDKAIQSLTVLISEKSELYELWSEQEEIFPKWKEIYEQIIKRLEN